MINFFMNSPANIRFALAPNGLGGHVESVTFCRLILVIKCICERRGGHSICEVLSVTVMG